MVPKQNFKKPAVGIGATFAFQILSMDKSAQHPGSRRLALLLCTVTLVCSARVEAKQRSHLPQKIFPKKQFAELYSFKNKTVVYRSVHVDPSAIGSRHTLLRYLGFKRGKDPSQTRRTNQVKTLLGTSLEAYVGAVLGRQGFMHSGRRIATCYGDSSAIATHWGSVCENLPGRNSVTNLVAAVTIDPNYDPAFFCRGRANGPLHFVDLYFKPTRKQVTWYLPVKGPSALSRGLDYKLYPIRNHNGLAKKMAAGIKSGTLTPDSLGAFAQNLVQQGILTAPRPASDKPGQ